MQGYECGVGIENYNDIKEEILLKPRMKNREVAR